MAVASGVAEARGLAGRRAAPAFIVERRLPDGDGLDFVRWLRETHDPTLPVAFVSATHADAAGFRFLQGEVGVDFVMTKPLSERELGGLLCVLRDRLQRTAPDDQDPAFLIELKDEYCRGIPERVERFEHYVRAAAQAPAGQVLAEFRSYLHQTVGSAGCYGYSSVARLCRQLELEVEAISADPQSMPSDWPARLQRFLRSIRHAFQGLPAPEE